MSEHRRGFLGKVLGGLTALLGLGGAANNAATVASYYFDWTKDEPFTDDPRYIGRLRSGWHNRVTCNGVEVYHVLRFKTGTDGWIEHYPYDEQSVHYQEVLDRWDKDRVVDLVERPRGVVFNVCRPPEVEGGAPDYKYKTRRTTVVRIGLVEYTDQCPPLKRQIATRL